MVPTAKRSVWCLARAAPVPFSWLDDMPGQSVPSFHLSGPCRETLQHLFLKARPLIKLSFPLRPTDRDFRGHGDTPPPVRWPHGARLALSIVVNVEEGAELSLGAGDASNEFIYEATEKVEGVRDL